MNVFVLSTMTQSVGYAHWETVDGVPIQRSKIMIHGGAGIPSLKSGFGEMTQNAEGQPLWTAEGIVTSITEEQYDVLKEHKVFKQHLSDGLVKVVNKNISDNHKEVKKHAADMSHDSFRVLDSKSIKMRIKVTTDVVDKEQQFRL